MKILWFTNSPCGSVRRFNSKTLGGGWLISLEDEVKKYTDVNLNVCYISDKKEENFVFEDVHYYPVLREHAKNGLKRIWNRFNYSLERDRVQLLPQIKNVADIVKPDIIHIHGTEECFGLIQDVIEDIPIIFSMQGLITSITEKYYAGYPAEFVRKYEPWHYRYRGINSVNDYNNLKEKVKRELHYLNHAKYVIGRTQFDHIIPLLFNSNVRLFQCEEILRHEFYTKQWNKFSFGKPLTIVSTISGGVYKGYETVLHTAVLLKQYADFDFEWLVIGYDDKSPWVHIAEKYKGYKSNDSNVKLLGRKTAPEMVDILNNCDIYVQVSHIENSPNSVCEAMLLGMPIIASFAGGTSSILKDGEEGILVQDGDSYVLGGAIVNLANDFNRAKAMGDKARQRAFIRHNPQNICNHLIEIYNDILSK